MLLLLWLQQSWSALWLPNLLLLLLLLLPLLSWELREPHCSARGGGGLQPHRFRVPESQSSLVDIVRPVTFYCIFLNWFGEGVA